MPSDPKTAEPKRRGADRGQTAVQYGIVLAVIAVAMIVGVGMFGRGVETKYDCATLSVDGGSDLAACGEAAAGAVTELSQAASPDEPAPLPTAQSCPAPCPSPSICVDGGCYCFSCNETCAADTNAGCGERFNGGSATVCCPPTGGRASFCNHVGCCCKTQLCGYEGSECRS
jgi:Flp pilus assembly pilin Flp